MTGSPRTQSKAAPAAASDKQREARGVQTPKRALAPIAAPSRAQRVALAVAAGLLLLWFLALAWLAWVSL